MEDESQEETPTNSESSGNNTIKIIGVIVIVIIIAFAIWEFALKGKSSMAPSQSMQQQPGSPTSGAGEAQATPASISYKDGTYSATGHYVNPAGQEAVDVSLTIKDGKVTGATFVGHPDNPTTVTMQNKFKAGFMSEVVGKPIDQINLTVVNGSSLAPKGFMDALSQIKSEARA